MNITPENPGFYDGQSGTGLAIEQYKGIIGRSACDATARQIVEAHPDKADLIRYIADILMGIEQIKHNERRKICV